RLPFMEGGCCLRSVSGPLGYASHLGSRSWDEPLFRDSVGSLDPVAHVEFAAHLGLAGVQHALALARSRAEQEAVGAAMARLGLETGCVIYTTFDNLRRPRWSDAGSEARGWLAAELARAFDTAHRVGSRYLAVLSGADLHKDATSQRSAFIDNLRWAAERAEKAGLVLLLESVDRNRLPGMLLHHIADAHDVV